MLKQNIYKAVHEGKTTCVLMEEFYRIKRAEYEYARKHNLKFLEEAIRQCVKKSIALNKLKLQPKQLELFD